MATTEVDSKPAAKPKAAVKKVAVKKAVTVTKAKPDGAAKSKVSKAKIALEPPKAKKSPENKAKTLPEVKEKVKKPKLVRDSFTMPESEYEMLGNVKKACLKAGIEVKKSELLRVGVALISAMDIAKLKDAITALTPLKAGRPKKDK
jgi:hypothetical protein